LNDGHLAVGDEIQILPSGLTGRVRGLQTHKKKEDRALPGSRTAVNISGIGTDQIRRGEVLIHPGQYQVTRRVDAHFRLIADASSAIEHNTEVKVFLGTTETVATLRLLGKEELQPGQEGWIQLELRDPILAVRGDRYILRRPSPGETLGGGAIVDPQPKARHRRFDEQVLKSLASLAEGSPAEVLYEAALSLLAAPLKDMVARSHLEPEPASVALKELIREGKLVLLEEGGVNSSSDVLAIASPPWMDLRAQTDRIISSYHGKYPLRRGIPREELKSRLNLTPRLFNGLIKKFASESMLVEVTNWVAKIGHEIRFDGSQQAKVRSLMLKFAQNPYSPPGIKECQAEAGEEIVNALIEMGELMAVSSEVVFRKQDYDSIVVKVRAAIADNGRITLAEVRDLFKTSRKYAQALLEHLDSSGITMRDGDYRKLRK
jgi:selenocysteine-specific elongation factor